MASSPLLTIAFFIAFFTFPTHCAGVVEIIVSSPQTVVLSSTVCTVTRCLDIDDDARKVKVTAGKPYRFQDAPFNGTAPRFFDLHLSVYSTTEEEIGSIYESPTTDSSWQTGAIGVDGGFNVTFRYRTICDLHYYGTHCNRFCQESVERHTECTRSGERRCMDGWTGKQCLTPVCSKGCNGKGKCVAPETCACNHGYRGPQCQECIPLKGCVHGSCANNVSDTCQCHPGYGGELCTRDLEMCQRQRPCKNGVCLNGGAKGFTCQCSPGFVGERCEHAVENVKCNHENGRNVCLNGGTCTSLSANTIQCYCRPGFFGKFCEQGGSDQCSSIECKNGGSCVLGAKRMPVCQCATCYKGPRCETLDAECLVSRVNASIQVKRTNGFGKIVRTEDGQTGRRVEFTVPVLIAISLILIIILSSSVLLCVVYIKFKKMMNSQETNRQSTDVDSLDSVACGIRAKPVYKVCVIDTERQSDSNSEPSRESREWVVSSPPPAYYPPLPKYTSTASSSSNKQYHTLPTVDPSSHPDDIPAIPFRKS